MILTLEEQVCSLESSLLLEKLGCPQESLFYWRSVNGEWTLRYLKDPEELNVSWITYVSAYTVVELLKMLPNDTELSRRHHQYYICNSELGSGEQWLHFRQDDLLAVNSCAKMLIYLLKNELIVKDQS